MDPKSHTNGVGNIVTNLQALETVLRGFLVERFGQCAAFPNMGDKTACRNYLTAYASLGALIDDYHRDLGEHEKNFSINPTVVLVRDALAHGRLIVRGNEPGPPFELWKFGKVQDGKVQVEFSETLTEDWLKSKWLLIDGERQKVFDCGKGRGYKRLS
jgi:hypothetical protein